MIVSAAFFTNAVATVKDVPGHKKSQDYASEADVIAALDYSKKKSPQLHEDALRVWKNFKSGKSEPHYSYRFWARNLVLWLRENRQLGFNDQGKVGRIFDILRQKKLISDDAAVILTVDAWGFLIHREGIPEMEKRLPQHQQEHNNSQEQEA